TKAEYLLFSNNFNGKSISARLSARIKAGLVSGVIEMADTANGFIVKKPVYSGKGFGYFAINTPVKIITVGINSYHISENIGQGAVSEFLPNLNPADFSVKLLETKRQKGQVSLTEAEVIVSGGRGMKGPENWKL